MANEATQGQQAAAPAVEKQTNCLVCNKPLKRLKKFYRNGKYYCTKKCWIKSKSKKATGEEEAK